MSKKKPEIASIKNIEIKSYKGGTATRSVKIKVKVTPHLEYAIENDVNLQNDLGLAIERVMKKHTRKSYL